MSNDTLSCDIQHAEREECKRRNTATGRKRRRDPFDAVTLTNNKRQKREEEVTTVAANLGVEVEVEVEPTDEENRIRAEQLVRQHEYARIGTAINANRKEKYKIQKQFERKRTQLFKYAKEIGRGDFGASVMVFVQAQDGTMRSFASGAYQDLLETTNGRTLLLDSAASSPSPSDSFYEDEERYKRRRMQDKALVRSKHAFTRTQLQRLGVEAKRAQPYLYGSDRDSSSSPPPSQKRKRGAASAAAPVVQQRKTTSFSSRSPLGTESSSSS